MAEINLSIDLFLSLELIVRLVIKLLIRIIAGKTTYTLNVRCIVKISC